MSDDITLTNGWMDGCKSRWIGINDLLFIPHETPSVEYTERFGGVPLVPLPVFCTAIGGTLEISIYIYI